MFGGVQHDDNATDRGDNNNNNNNNNEMAT